MNGQTAHQNWKYPIQKFQQYNSWRVMVTLLSGKIWYESGLRNTKPNHKHNINNKFTVFTFWSQLVVNIKHQYTWIAYSIFVPGRKSLELAISVACWGVKWNTKLPSCNLCEPCGTAQKIHLFINFSIYL